MKYSHFIAFASEMLREEMGSLADLSSASEGLQDAQTVCSIGKAVLEAVKDPACNEQRLIELANEIGMYEYIEAWADDEEFAMHELALNYVG